MSGVEGLALNYLVNSLWQTPLVAFAAWIAARLVRQNGPRWQHRAWVTALLLEAGLPLWRSPIVSLAWLYRWLHGAPASGGAVRTFTGQAAVTRAALPLSAAALKVAASLYGVLLLYFAARLVWRLLRTYAMIARAVPLERSHLAGTSLASSNVRLLVSPAVAGPVSAGLARGVLVVPPDYLDRLTREDRDAMLAHEFAHLARHDFAKNLLYEILLLPIAYHPAAWFTRARVAESREMICDTIAAGANTDAQSYARSLLRLAAAQSRQAHTLHAIGILDAHTLERRVMQLTRIQSPTSMLRSAASLAACAVLAVATCGSALALHMNVSASSTGGTETSQPLHVDAGKIAGNRISGENPVYPPEAKAKGIQGQVVISATISKHGQIEDAKAISGPEALRESSLKAVRTWRYKPYLQNGRAVAVETTINVIYGLGNSK